jgi:hypothetical protein
MAQSQRPSFTPGERVGLVVLGAATQRQLIGTTSMVHDDIVEVVLATPRLADLAAGRLVSMRGASRVAQMLQVVEVHGGWEPRVVLRAVTLPGAQQRQELRHVLVQPRNLLASVLAQGRASAFRVVVLDISRGGLGLLTQRVVALGDQVRLRLGRPGEEASATATTAAGTVAGTVAWVVAFGQRWRAGVRFSDLDAAQHGLVEQLLETNEQDWQHLLDQADSAPPPR